MNLPVDASWVTFAEAAVKSAVLLVAAAAGAWVLRRRSAASRHAVWTLGLVAALLLPLASVALPEWEVPLVTVAAPPGLGAWPTVEGEAIDPASTPRRPSRARESADSPATPVAVEARAGDASRVAFAGAVSWQIVLIAVWAAGAALVFSRLLLGLAAVVYLSRRTERVTDAPWLAQARALAAEVGIARPVAFQRTRSASMPMAWGLLRPSILMPAEADDWPADRLRIVLLHELAHVRRRDCLTHALAQVACAIYWFNPLVWMAAKQARAERERACDDLVLAAGTTGPDYADQLLEIARGMREGRFPALLAGATLAMAHRSQLEGRLMAILDPAVHRSGVSRTRTAFASILTGCLVVPFATVQPWAYESAVAHRPTPAAQRPAPTPTPTPDPAPSPRVTGMTPRPQPKPAVTEDIVAEATAAIRQAVANLPAGLVEGVIEGALEGALTGAIGGVTGQTPAGDSQPRSDSKKADPRTIAALTAALKDSDAQVREAAMHALVRLRDPSIYEPLVQALHDASADIREQAAMGLAMLRDRRAVGPLTQALKDDSASVREQAVFGLGQLRDEAAASAIALALKDSSASVREQAVFALGQLRSREHLDSLAAALKDASPAVREQAAFALGHIRDPRALMSLVAALKDENGDVRHHAAFGLGQLRDRAAVEALVIALKDRDADVRAQAAFALGRIGDPRAIDPLTLALKDASADVRQQAAFALGQLAR